MLGIIVYHINNINFYKSIQEYGLAKVGVMDADAVALKEYVTQLYAMLARCR